MLYGQATNFLLQSLTAGRLDGVLARDYDPPLNDQQHKIQSGTRSLLEALLARSDLLCNITNFAALVEMISRVGYRQTAN